MNMTDNVAYIAEQLTMRYGDELKKMTLKQLIALVLREEAKIKAETLGYEVTEPPFSGKF